MQNSPIQKQIISLIHHVELNKAGWWDRGIQQLIAASLWLIGTSLHLEGVLAELKKNFAIHIDTAKLKIQLAALCLNNTLVKLPNGQYKLSEQAQKELEQRCIEAEQIEKEAKESFREDIERHCPSLDHEHTWRQFNDNFLLPLIKEMGARTYELISGVAVPDKVIGIRAFMEKFPPDARPFIRDAIIAFIDPRNAVSRSYILRYMNNCLFVEASNLSEETIKALSAEDSRVPEFALLVDTNFLFSLLSLHDNPSNEAAVSLQALIRQLQGKLKVQLFVSPETVDETRRVIEFHKEAVGHLKLTSNLATPALRTERLRGIVRKFVVESSMSPNPVSAEDYFGPYVSGLVGILKSKGVELFNEKMDQFSVKQEVIDDITVQMEYEKRLFSDRGKSYEALRHDMVLWHFVQSKRPINVESPSDAKYWVVTIDFRFLAFDAFKRRNVSHKIPICVHPAALIQLLQFWIPRTVEFEDALLGSLRLPLLFHEFDPAAEKITIRILQVLSRFENINNLSESAVHGILVNDALRQKLSSELDERSEIELVKEALIEEERKVREELVSAKKTIVAQHDSLQAAEERLEQLTSELLIVKQHESLKTGTTAFVRRFVVAPVGLILIISVIASFLASRFFNLNFWSAFLGVVCISLFPWISIIDVKGSQNKFVSESRMFLSFHRWKSLCFWLVGTFFLGICINAIWDGIKHYLFGS